MSIEIELYKGPLDGTVVAIENEDELVLWIEGAPEIDWTSDVVPEPRRGAYIRPLRGGPWHWAGWDPVRR